MRAASTARTGTALAILSAVAFGGSGVAAKPLINAGLDPLHMAWLRVTLAALITLPVAIRHRGLLRGRLRPLLSYGAFAVVGMQAFYFTAIARIPVGVALLIEFLGPALLLGWFRFVARRPVARSAAVGAGLALVGLAGVVQIWRGLELDPLGIAAALAAAGCLAASFVLSDKGSGKHEPIPAAALIAYGMLVGAVLLTPIARPWQADWGLLAERLPMRENGPELPALVFVGWVVLVSTVLAYVTKVPATRMLSSQVASVVSYTEAVVG
ncbi:EamA family transporter, partial [Streptomyces sp. URMC 123]|uniref:EamA family transporter n=1 Tax=Streptomyces sp. URMC 123 TaxID=3423403 RepID=UPI003F1D3A14